MNKRIAIIGDIHCRYIWKEFVKISNINTFIFLGDYFDSFNKGLVETQVENFYELLNWVEKNNGVLLCGNHELHYFSVIGHRYSGYNRDFSLDIEDALDLAISKNLLKACHLEDNYLFTHAGVSKTWCINNRIDYTKDIDIQINDLFKKSKYAFKFTSGIYYDNYGDEICQTPMWIRPRSLKEDMIENYIQVVGHTHQPSIVIDNPIFLDVLDTTNECLIIDLDNNKLNITKL